MKRKIIVGILTLTIVAGLFAGCGKKTAEPGKYKAGTLSLLNITEEDYGKFQDATRSLIEGVEAGTAPEEIKTDESGANTNGNKTEFVFYDDLTSMIMGLNTGDIQGVQVYSCVGRYICSSNNTLEMKDLYSELKNEEAKKAVENMYSDGFSFMMSDSNRELRDEFDEAIMEMKNDGTLDRLAKEQIEDVIGGKAPESIAMEETDGADTIKVAVTGDLPPLDYVSPDGKPGGFNTAVLSEIGKRIGKNIELVTVNSASRAIALESGNVDVVFWTRNSVEGIAPEGEPDAAGKPDGEDPADLREAPSDLPEIPDDPAIGGMSLDDYKKRDMPDGTVVTVPYYIDRFVMLEKK